jgi:thiamine biosynthesis lipoprotein ApbE
MGMLEIGGELRSWGQRPDGRPWQVQLGTGGSAEAESLVVACREVRLPPRAISGISSRRLAGAIRTRWIRARAGR